MKDVVQLIDDGKFAEAKSKLKDIVGERIEKKVTAKQDELGLVKEAKKIKKEEDEKDLEKDEKDLEEQEEDDDDKKEKESDEDDDEKEVDEKKGKK